MAKDPSFLASGKVKLADFDPNYTGKWTRDTARAERKQIRDEMRELQERLYAEGQQALLIVLQAMDAGGKDGTIKKVFTGVNPQGVRIASFKRPTSLELDHDFLWRVHQQVPPKGYIGIFNRSHYEDVLVARVNELAPKKQIEARYDHINNFERLLMDTGTRILKFYLNISKAEQKERFQKRLDRPDKQWKFSMGDLPVREQWDDYMRAFEIVFERCSPPNAPWHIVPANNKWYRNLVITRTIVETLKDMDPQFPPPEDNLDGVVIPD
jgi:PPK2 family polyphosphate:nucleotide phosphotransferase